MNYDFELIFARKRKRMTQQQLAEKAGVTRGTINKIEGGKHRSNFDLMCKIYKAVGLDYTKSEHILKATDGKFTEVK